MCGRRAEKQAPATAPRRQQPYSKKPPRVKFRVPTPSARGQRLCRIHATMFQDPATLGITGVMCITATIVSMYQVRRGVFFAPTRVCPSSRPLNLNRAFSSFLDNPISDQVSYRISPLSPFPDLHALGALHPARAPAVHHPHSVHGPSLCCLFVDFASRPQRWDLFRHRAGLLRELGDLQLPCAVPGVRGRRR